MAKGLWEDQLAENRINFKRQLKIRAWVAFTFTVLDFAAVYIVAKWFVEAVAAGSSTWWTFLLFAVAALFLGWLRRDSARFLVVSKNLREARDLK